MQRDLEHKKCLLNRDHQGEMPSLHCDNMLKVTRHLVIMAKKDCRCCAPAAKQNKDRYQIHVDNIMRTSLSVAGTKSKNVTLDSEDLQKCRYS